MPRQTPMPTRRWGLPQRALYAQFVEEEDGSGRDFSAMLPRFAGRGRKE
jgi:3-hydroxyisobutyrate dehydrogenase